MERGHFTTYNDNYKENDDGKVELVMASIWDMAARLFSAVARMNGDKLLMHPDDIEMFEDLQGVDDEA